MSEQPAYTLTETPVLDPNLFLLNRANRAFIERRNDNPYFLKVRSTLTFQESSILLGTGLLFSMYLCMILASPQGIGSAIAGTIVAIFIILFAGVRPANPDTDNIDLAGWILPGVVLHSEKVRVEREQSWREHLGIRFEFTTPEEVVTEAYAEGESNKASDKMAPFPGTPVRVWYGDDGKVFLL